MWHASSISDTSIDVPTPCHTHTSTHRLAPSSLYILAHNITTIQFIVTGDLLPVTKVTIKGFTHSLTYMAMPKLSNYNLISCRSLQPKMTVDMQMIRSIDYAAHYYLCLYAE